VINPSLLFTTWSNFHPLTTVHTAPSSLLTRYSAELRSLRGPRKDPLSLDRGLSMWFSAIVDASSPSFCLRLRGSHILGSLMNLYNRAIPHLSTSPLYAILDIFSHFLPPSSSSTMADQSHPSVVTLRPPILVSPFDRRLQKLRACSLARGRTLSVFFDSLQQLSRPDLALGYFRHLLSLTPNFLRRVRFDTNSLHAFGECRGRTGSDPLETADAFASLKSPGLDFETAVTKEIVAFLLHDVARQRGRSAVAASMEILERGGFREGVLREGRALFSKTNSAGHVWAGYNDGGERAREKQARIEEAVAREREKQARREERVARRRALLQAPSTRRRAPGRGT
jgi:hypothetical protein